MNLKSMSLNRLTDLRERVDTALASKVIDQRRTIETELAKLSRLQGANPDHAPRETFSQLFRTGARHRPDHLIGVRPLGLQRV